MELDLPAPYLDRIRACLPDLSITTAVLNRDGLMNDVVVLNDTVVVRFAKGERARATLIRECAILELMHRYVQAPVPRITHFHGDLMIYDFIPGAPLTQDALLRLDAASQERIAEHLALFLGRMHQIPRATLAQHGLATSDATRTQEDWERLYLDVERELFPSLMAHQRTWIRRFFAPVLAGEMDLAYDPVLIHGDLAAYHILHDPAHGALTGVIDFGTGGLGDPAIDYACVIQVLGESFLRRMMRYTPLIKKSLDRARFRASALELEWAVQGAQTNDAWWWTAHLGNARDLLPLGTDE